MLISSHWPTHTGQVGPDRISIQEVPELDVRNWTALSRNTVIVWKQQISQ